MPKNPTGPIVRLRVKDGGSTRIYRLYGRGAQYCFIKDEQTHTHVLDIPLAEWQANDFRVAKDIFQEQRAIVVIPDFIPGKSVDADAGTNGEELPEETLKLIEDLEAKIAALEANLADNQKLIDASAKRIEELAAKPVDPPTMTPSEAGKILGNGISEPQDSEAARVLAESAMSNGENSGDNSPPSDGEKELTPQQRAAITRATNKAKKEAEKAKAAETTAGE